MADAVVRDAELDDLDRRLGASDPEAIRTYFVMVPQAGNSPEVINPERLTYVPSRNSSPSSTSCGVLEAEIELEAENCGEPRIGADVWSVPFTYPELVVSLRGYWIRVPETPHPPNGRSGSSPSTPVR